MIRRRDLVEAFERELAQRESVDPARNLRIFEALYHEACLLGVFPLRDPLDGIEVDIRLARAINVRISPPANRDRV